MKTRLTFKTMLRPIHDRVSYKNALEITDLLAGQDMLTTDQEDYFEALCLLIEAYENSLESLPNKKGLSLLKHLVEENNMSAADLARLLGIDRSLGVRILSGERHITVSHAKKMSSRFNLPLEIFLT